MDKMKADYRSLVGPEHGAKKIHVHLTILDPAGERLDKQHTHAAEEAIYILEGEAEFTFDGKTHRVGPGDSIFFPSNVLHAKRKFFTEKMKYLIIRSVEPGDEPCCCTQKHSK